MIEIRNRIRISKELNSNSDVRELSDNHSDKFGIVGFHRRYGLNLNCPDYVRKEAKELLDAGNGFEAVADKLSRSNNWYKFYPLFMYDHGDIALSISDYNDKFDSGFLGYVFVNKDVHKAITDKNFTLIGKNRKELVKFLDDYSNYINGYVYDVFVEVIDEDYNTAHYCCYGNPDQNIVNDVIREIEYFYGGVELTSEEIVEIEKELL